jgi:hypothetical protein
MGEVMRRTHTNGWVAVVEAALDGDQLLGYAVSPKGEPHHLSGAVEPGVEDYDDRLEQAKEAADDLVIMLGPHTPCECPPWHKAPPANG